MPPTHPAPCWSCARGSSSTEVPARAGPADFQRAVEALEPAAGAAAAVGCGSAAWTPKRSRCSRGTWRPGSPQCASSRPARRASRLRPRAPSRRSSRRRCPPASSAAFPPTLVVTRLRFPPRRRRRRPPPCTSGLGIAGTCERGRPIHRRVLLENAGAVVCGRALAPAPGLGGWQYPPGSRRPRTASDRPESPPPRISRRTHGAAWRQARTAGGLARCRLRSPRPALPSVRRRADGANPGRWCERKHAREWARECARDRGRPWLRSRKRAPVPNQVQQGGGSGRRNGSACLRVRVRVRSRVRSRFRWRMTGW
jgi:hypothetical protein